MKRDLVVGRALRISEWPLLSRPRFPNRPSWKHHRPPVPVPLLASRHHPTPSHASFLPSFSTPVPIPSQTIYFFAFAILLSGTIVKIALSVKQSQKRLCDWMGSVSAVQFLTALLRTSVVHNSFRDFVATVVRALWRSS
ncbi:hypothetical protein BDP27DRAFT_1325828 [Rhodocollybia butyracea]|uniref:Uncharacterized protein n=1 Tax=Rhodocollybia butyracea TaxID=206335 RepID=A0A9P5PNL7_9AGAR|nr:hypothetical protein BDP27DRAFT_1325828 [Rhodocollybia butyracea]